MRDRSGSVVPIPRDIQDIPNAVEPDPTPAPAPAHEAEDWATIVMIGGLVATVALTALVARDAVIIILSLAIGAVVTSIAAQIVEDLR